MRYPSARSLLASLLVGALLFAPPAQAAVYDVSGIPAKSTGDAFTATEVNLMVDMLRNLKKNDQGDADVTNDWFGIGVAGNPGYMLDVNGTVNATAFRGDGAQITNLPNPGLWTQTANDIYYNTGKVAVGINSSPTYQLEVHNSGGSSAIDTVASGSNSASLRLTNGSQVWIVRNNGSSSNAFEIYNSTDSSTAMTVNASSNRVDFDGDVYASNFIDSGSGGPVGGKFVDGTNPNHAVYTDGNVGIGTTNPETILDMRYASPSPTAASITTADLRDLGLYIADTSLDNTNGEVTTGIGFGYNTESTTGIISVDEGGGGAAGLGFVTGNNTSVAERLRISNTGNVGIGTTSPGTTLDVNGVARFGNSYENVLRVGPLSTSPAYFYIDTKIPFTNGGAAPRIKIEGYNYATPSISSTDLTIELYVWAGAFYLKRYESAPGYLDPSRIRVGTYDDSGTTRIRLEIANDSNYWTHFFVSAHDSVASAAYYNDWSYAIGAFPGGTGNIATVDKSNSGNIGIGTNVPAEALHINKSAPNIRLTDTDTGADSYLLANSGSGGLVLSADQNDEVASSYLGLMVDGSEEVRVTESGRVGIGTTSPGADLHLYNSASGQTPTNVTGMFIENNGTSNSYYALQIATAGPGKSFSVTNAGNVGIGTTTPAYELDVAGDINVTGDFLKNGSPFGEGKFVDGTPTASEAVYTTGNVGIGTTDPEVALEVDGVIRAGDASTVAGSTILEGKYAGSNVINTIGGQYSSGATVIGYAVRPKPGAGGFVSSADNASFNRGALSVTHELVFSSATSVSAAKGADVALAEKFRVATSGNVGIGTTSPSESLTINKAASNIRLTDTDTGADSYILTNSGVGGMVLAADNNNEVAGSYMAFNVDGSEAMRIFESGHVGVGTSLPFTPLDVSGSNTNGRSLTLRSGDTATGTDSKQVYFTYNNQPYIGNAYAHAIGTRHNAAAESGNAIDFWLWDQAEGNPAGPAGKRVMTLDGTGNVGIGESTPLQKMHVQDGTLLVQNDAGSPVATYNGVTIVSDNASDFTDDYAIYSAGAATTPAFFSGKMRGTWASPAALQSGDIFGQFYANGWDGTGWSGMTGIRMVAAGNYTGGNSPADMDFRVNGALRMRLNDDGNVGIGNITPTEELHIRTDQTAPTRVTVQNASAGASTTVRSGVVAQSNGGQIEMMQYGTGATGSMGDQTRADAAFIRTSASLAPSKLVVGTGSTIPLHLTTDDTTRMTIDGSGNVGIGNTDPQSDLDVNGTITSRSAALLRRYTSGWTNAQNTDVLYNSFSATLGDNMMIRAQGNGQNGGAILVSDALGSFFGFRSSATGTADNTASATAPLTTTHARIGQTNWFTGDVGIGTTSPAAKLDVRGNVSIPDAGSTLSFGNNTQQMINLYSNSYGIGIQASTLYLRSDNNFAIYQDGVHSNGVLDPGTGGNVIIASDSQREVGIGTTTPNQPLHVMGDIRIEDGTGNALYFGAGSQYIMGDNGSALYHNSNHSTATQMIFRDAENTQYGRIYGSGNGTNFGLMDGDADFTFLSRKDSEIELRINDQEEVSITPTSLGFSGDLKRISGTLRCPVGEVMVGFDDGTDGNGGLLCEPPPQIYQ